MKPLFDKNSRLRKLDLPIQAHCKLITFLYSGLLGFTQYIYIFILSFKYYARNDDRPVQPAVFYIIVR